MAFLFIVDPKVGLPGANNEDETVKRAYRLLNGLDHPAAYRTIGRNIFLLTGEISLSSP